MAVDFNISNAVAILGLDAIVDSIDTGTAPVLTIYSGTAPVDCDTALSGNTILAELLMNATAAFGASADATDKARATAAAITSDTSANATGTASFFRILIDAASTVRMQGTVGTATSDLILNTVAITSGSTVSVTSATIDLPEGP